VCPREGTTDERHARASAYLVLEPLLVTGVASRSSRKGDLQDVTASSNDEDFMDLDFRLMRARTLKDGTFVAAGRGQHKGAAVGFEVAIGALWDERVIGEEDDSLVLYWGRVQLLSAGAESDVLVQSLDELYETGLGAKRMRARSECLAVGLGNDPRRAASQRTCMKLFLHEDDSERYAEVYLNVDVPSDRIELHEKDPEYRRNVVRGLARSTLRAPTKGRRRSASW
jgi:hypothetical protein